MSGRVSVTLADGRHVTGYRKTLRVNRRRTPEERVHVLNVRRANVHKSEWKVRVGFHLPKDVLIANGPHGLGIHVYQRFVHVSGTSSEECFKRAADFLRPMLPFNGEWKILCSVISLDRPEEHYTRHISITNGLAITFCGGSVEPLVY